MRLPHALWIFHLLCNAPYKQNHSMYSNSCSRMGIPECFVKAVSVFSDYTKIVTS